ncbi:hypothetical protein G9C85_16505 [Halorubellus sp. JP-L1]|uniref:DUF7501 family protein n=1 Tax=Halorubellus sp. JP-L1 TaxID=2715753 RepID=UPI00140C4CF4|nr:hypothetical protein [Halorubellus sp. JP-L1]NHN43220.1 hypothetical protein [Halorubellus sp. JP-L1]
MSVGTPTANWTSEYNCPFCDSTLENPGVAFVDHIETSAECKSGHDAWTFHVAGDFGGA